MAKVYLMIEDFQHEAKEGIDWGVEWGLEEGEELPEDVNDMTLAQYTVWQLMTVLKRVGNANMKENIEAEQKKGTSPILVPEKMQ